MLSKTKPAAAWACGVCGNLYRKNDSGKKSAEACCLCGACGAMKERCGLGGYCKKCGLKKTIASNEQHFLELHKSILEHQSHLARLDPDYKTPDHWKKLQELFEDWPVVPSATD